MTIKDLAEEMLNFFEAKKVEDSFGTYKRFFTTKERPQLLDDIIREVHRADYDMLPDDFKYEFVYYALAALLEYDDPNEATLEPDTYTSDLMRWLNSHSYRLGRVDDAIQSGVDNIFDAMQYAQAEEMNEVLDIVRNKLIEHIEKEG